jgi:hypothetical protein
MGVARKRQRTASCLCSRIMFVGVGETAAYCVVIYIVSIQSIHTIMYHTIM